MHINAPGRRSLFSACLCALVLPGLAAPSPAPDEAPTPVFHFRCGLTQFQRASQATPAQVATVLRALVPDELKSNVVLSLPCSMNALRGAADAVEYCRKFDQYGYRFVVEISDTSVARSDKTRTTLYAPALKQIFESTTNCVGVETGETFWHRWDPALVPRYGRSYHDEMAQWTTDILDLCVAQQKYFILGEFMWSASNWPRFFFENRAGLTQRGYGRCLVPMYKGTGTWGAHVTRSSLLGAWLTGEVEHFGMWNDEYTWGNSGGFNFTDANEFPRGKNGAQHNANYQHLPYTHFLKEWLLSISQGADRLFLEASLSFADNGKLNSNHTDYLLPFIRGVAQHHLVPSKQAVLAKTKVLVDPFGSYPHPTEGKYEYDPRSLAVTYTQKPTAIFAKKLDPFYTLLKNTYGFWSGYPETHDLYNRGPDRLFRDELPNTARYFALPLLPYPDAPVPPGLRVLKLTALQTDGAVTNALDPLYPPDPHDTVAYAVEVDNSFFVFNTHENYDVDQYFRLDLGRTGVRYLEGKLPLQNIVFGKREGANNYWFQVNGYTRAPKLGGRRYMIVEKDTQLTFGCATQPTITVEDGKDRFMAVVSPWTPATRQVTLKFNHAEGAVNFRLQLSPVPP